MLFSVTYGVTDGFDNSSDEEDALEVVDGSTLGDNYGFLLGLPLGSDEGEEDDPLLGSDDVANEGSDDGELLGVTDGNALGDDDGS